VTRGQGHHQFSRLRQGNLCLDVLGPHILPLHLLEGVTGLRQTTLICPISCAGRLLSQPSVPERTRQLKRPWRHSFADTFLQLHLASYKVRTGTTSLLRRHRIIKRFLFLLSNNRMPAGRFRR
jgi:hypothetical protein